MIRLEIISYNKVVFEGDFPDLSSSQDFFSWWSNQTTLPQGGAIHYKVNTNNGFISTANNMIRDIAYTTTINLALVRWKGKRVEISDDHAYHFKYRGDCEYRVAELHKLRE